MSVNITVNGKFSKHCRTNPLDDPQQVRKQEEQERRKLRLLQVREESKKLAKKIRDDVNEEKNKQLKKLQDTKEQEMECWRQHAIERSGEDYREAIFQVGTAHKAARMERQEQAEKQKKTQGTYKDFKKQVAARKCNPGKVKFNEVKSCKCQKSCPDKKMQCTCTQTDMGCQNYNDEPHKRKRDSCFSSSDSECEDEGYKEQTLPQSSLCSTSSSIDSSLSSLGNNRCTQTSMFAEPTMFKHQFHKTPAVFLDVEVGSDDSVIITAPAEVNDKHAQNNRQFSSVIRLSPSRGRKTKENKAENSKNQPKSSTTTTATTTICSGTSTTTSSARKSSETIEDEKEVCQPITKPKAKSKSPQRNIQPTKEKRFTLISDIVRKQQDQIKPPVQVCASNQTEFIPTKPTVSRATSDTVTPQLSPRKQAKTKALTTRPTMARPSPQPSRKASAASSKTSRTVTEKSHVIATLNNGVASGCSSSGKVQFYDYNSKMSRECVPAQTLTKVQRQNDNTEPTAMEQAALENQREMERQQELQQKNKQVEERGQKAIEREQVRRDCNELTEKLEALTREYPKQVPTSENQNHLFVDKQLRKEGKMNTAVEKLLMRPNIITCSELNKYNSNKNDQIKIPDTFRPVNNELNLGASAINNNLPADDVSSDSCCSILLGYVDVESRLIKQDLQHERQDLGNQTQKQLRLKNLLKRLDELRNSLVEELKTESESTKQIKSKSSSKEENLRQAIDSISELRKEREDILINEKAQEPKPIRDREKELQAKEAILEAKVREFYELQKQAGNPTTKKVSKEDLNKETKKKSTPSNNQKPKEDQTDNDKENVNCTSIENPLEIIITVRGETMSIPIPQKSQKRKSKLTKSSSKLATLIRSPQTKRHTPKKKLPNGKTTSGESLLKRQNSYDSNSTSYMSLPPAEMPTKIDDLVKLLAKERQQQQQPTATNSLQRQPNQEQENRSQHQKEKDKRRNMSSILDTLPASDSSSEFFDSTRNNQPPARVNPLIAQYVQRLLGMTRSTIQKLGVSSSDIETPGSSIINTSGNQTASETIVSEEHLINVQHFVDENRSFIKDLEQSIRSQNNESLENSLRTFDGIWQQYLRNQSKGKHSSRQNKPTAKSKQRPANETEESGEPRNKADKEKSPAKDLTANKNKTKDQRDKEKQRRTKELMDIISSGSKPTSKEDTTTTRTSSTDKEKTPRGPSPKTAKKTAKDKKKDLEKTLHSSQYSTDDKETPKRLKKRNPPVDKVDVAIETKLSQGEGDDQIQRYAKLTENCTHRIAELTELINRVREEKQRLLEVTLSSVSDTGRQSTEYLELPDGKSSTRNDQEDLTRISSSSEELQQNKQKRPNSDTPHEPTIPKLSSSDKNKQITASRDSGIADSRPATAQENRIDPEPISLSSSETNIAHPQRKLKPPPTMKRFSPQLPEDELAHELSTILEVDTPATSRIATAVGQLADERINITDAAMAPQQPILFPTFEQYVRGMDLDVTQLDPEQSMQLKNDFCNYLDCLQQQYSTAISPPQYNEFPSLNAYIANLLEGDNVVNIEESLAQLHISGINPQNFPAIREYLQRNASKASTENLQLIDTDSLENITEEPVKTNTENDSGSMDIEQELKQRKIMKNSFKYFQTKQQKVFSSTANKDASFYQEMIAGESGIEKLSTSDNSVAILESDLRRMVHQWPGQVRRKSQQYQILSSTTTSANTSALANSALKATSGNDSSNDVGQPLNLRDFLTRELLKHANISASLSSSSSDESLRSHFLHSIIGSLTPRTIGGAASKSGAQTLDRQKTSTPVPMQSSQTHSTTSNGSYNSSQLFSGESRISSVHYDRSVKFFTSDAGANADQSSE